MEETLGRSFTFVSRSQCFLMKRIIKRNLKQRGEIPDFRFFSEKTIIFGIFEKSARSAEIFRNPFKTTVVFYENLFFYEKGRLFLWFLEMFLKAHPVFQKEIFLFHFL